MALLDGKKVAREIQNKLQVKIDSLSVKPGLCVIMVGVKPRKNNILNIKLNLVLEKIIHHQAHMD